MINRETPAIRALVLHPVTPEGDPSRAPARIEEAAGLARALGMELARARSEPVRKIEAGRFFGSGKVDILKGEIDELEVQAVVIDTALTPVQQRNLERAWKVKVIDRTGLILEIFADRARTKEGALQVELARLTYERSRLVRTWTHLERQRGGRGFLAGPGETQIETDRRILSDRMAKLRRELAEVTRTRELHRKRRQDAPWPTVALVGYTNAGKSTLFNRLSKAQVLAKDMPFATLDPTVRAVRLPGGRRVLLSDTVGFITDLPTELIAAFRATLEEVREADVLVHVRDLSDPDHEGRKLDVEAVLDALGAGARSGQTIIEAWNKLDRLGEEEAEDALWRSRLPVRPGAPRTAAVSAMTGEGVEALLRLIERALGEDDPVLTLTLEPEAGKAFAWLHQNGDLLDERTERETGVVTMTVRLSPADLGRFHARFPEFDGQLRAQAGAHLEAAE